MEVSIHSIDLYIFSKGSNHLKLRAYERPLIMIEVDRHFSSATYVHIRTHAHLAHDDGSINGKLQVTQCAPDGGNDTLHPINLLAKEDVHWCQCTHLFQFSPHLKKVEQV